MLHPSMCCPGRPLPASLLCAWGPITPSLRMVHVGIACTFMVSAGVMRTSAGSARSFVVDVGGVCTCAVAWVVCAAQWLHRCPWFVPPQFVQGSFPILHILSSTVHLACPNSCWPATGHKGQTNHHDRCPNVLECKHFQTVTCSLFRPKTTAEFGEVPSVDA